LGKKKGRKKEEPDKYIYNIFYFILPMVKYTNLISNKKTMVSGFYVRFQDICEIHLLYPYQTKKYS